MDSFLKDTALAADETPQNFHPFLKKDDSENPPPESDADASPETAAETPLENSGEEEIDAVEKEQDEGEPQETPEVETESSPDAVVPTPDSDSGQSSDDSGQAAEVDTPLFSLNPSKPVKSYLNRSKVPRWRLFLKVAL